MSEIILIPHRDEPKLADGPFLALIHLQGAFVGSITATKFGYAAVNIHKGYLGYFPSFEQAEEAATKNVRHLCTTVIIHDERACAD
jgi:hypothetical protein